MLYTAARINQSTALCKSNGHIINSARGVKRERSNSYCRAVSAKIINMQTLRACELLRWWATIRRWSRNLFDHRVHALCEENAKGALAKEVHSTLSVVSFILQLNFFAYSHKFNWSKASKSLKNGSIISFHNFLYVFSALPCAQTLKNGVCRD